jgi:hypothetical protein
MSGNAAITTDWTQATKPLRRIEPLMPVERPPRESHTRLSLDGWTVEVAEDATWVKVCQRGAEHARHIDLARHGAPRRVLKRLLDEARTAPLATLSVRDLFHSGWPGESIRFTSQVKRVHTAIWTLRRAGLGDVLQTEDRKYRIHAHVVDASLDD